MLLLDTSFLVTFEDEVRNADRQGAAHAVLGAHRHVPMAISVITAGEFAEEFDDLGHFNDFIGRFQIVQLSRVIAWGAAQIQRSLRQRLKANDAWIAATALAHDATLVGRNSAFSCVPHLRYLEL